MKIYKKIIGTIFIASMMSCVLSACGKKTEAVITSDGEDITESYTEYPTMTISTSEKFSYTDLIVEGLKFLMTEDEVKKSLGEPVSVYETKENTENGSKSQILEHVLSYNDLSLIFIQIGGEYKLTAAASVSSKDIFARGIKVGDTIDDIFKLYYRDSDCMNNDYMTADETTMLGKYLYGSFTIDDLDNVKTKDQINYGVINYNGFQSIENAETYIIEFTSFDSTYKNGTASVYDDFAQLAFDMDNAGVITGIRWYYYPEED